MTEIGHNQGPDMGDAEPSGTAAAIVQDFVRRLENLEEEKRACLDDIKTVYGEAKAGGLDVKILRRLIARRKRDAADVQAEDELLAIYAAWVMG